MQQHYAEGFEQLRRILDPADPSYHPFVGTWGLADLVEAAVHTENNDAATAYLGQLEALVATTSGPLLHAQAAYARPLVTSDHAAEGRCGDRPGPGRRRAEAVLLDADARVDRAMSPC